MVSMLDWRSGDLDCPFKPWPAAPLGIQAGPWKPGKTCIRKKKIKVWKNHENGQIGSRALKIIKRSSKSTCFNTAFFTYWLRHTINTRILVPISGAVCSLPHLFTTIILRWIYLQHCRVYNCHLSPRSLAVLAAMKIYWNRFQKALNLWPNPQELGKACLSHDCL